jgi:hypothetical protein
VPDLVEHGGDWDTAHTYVGLVPEREFGIVLLSNINDRTMTTRYFYIELGLLNILSGKDPLEPRLFEPPIVRYGKPLLIGLLVLQLVAIAWTVVTVRRARSRRISSRFAIILGAGLALTVDAFVIYLLLAAAPQWYSASVIDVIRATPDVGPLMMLMLLLAVIWAPARTVALLWASRRREAGVPSGR